MNKIYGALLFMIVGLSVQAMEQPTKKRKIPLSNTTEEDKNKIFLIKITNKSDEALEAGRLSIVGRDVIIKDKQIIAPHNDSIIPYTHDMYLANRVLKPTADKLPCKNDVFVSLGKDEKTFQLTKVGDNQGLFAVLPSGHVEDGKNIFQPNNSYVYYHRKESDGSELIYIKSLGHAVSTCLKPGKAEFRYLKSESSFTPSLKDLCLLCVADNLLDTSCLPSELREQVDAIKPLL